MEVDGQRHAPAASHPRNRPDTRCVQGAGWAPGPAWTGTENLTPTGIRSLDHPPSSESQAYVKKNNIKMETQVKGYKRADWIQLPRLDTATTLRFP